MKNKILTLLIALVIMLLFAGCASSSGLSELENRIAKLEQEAENQIQQKESDFVGEYKSTYINVQNAAKNVSFELSIKADKTFTLIRKTGTVSDWTQNGTVKTITENGVVSLLCFITDVDSFSGLYIYHYFTINAIDDGTLAVVPSISNFTSGSARSAFGYLSGDVSIYITLIIFESK